MPSKRTSYTAEFKFMIASLALSDTMSIGELSSKYELHGTQISKWKKELQSRGQEIFEDKRKKDTKLSEKEKELEHLYKKLGKLTVENDWLKKKSVFLSLGK